MKKLFLVLAVVSVTLYSLVTMAQTVSSAFPSVGAIVASGWFSETAKDTAVLVPIFFFAAVMSGMSGFGFSAIGCLSLLVLPPGIAISLLMGLSLITQAQSFGTLYNQLQEHKAEQWRLGVGPYAIGGIAGIAIGTPLLTVLDGKSLMIGLGVFLLAYSSYSLLKPQALRLQNVQPSTVRSAAIGGAGGFIGAFSGFPGSAVVIWTGLTGVGKDASRALVQPFILTMQVVGLLLAFAVRPDSFGKEFFLSLLIYTPVALIGNQFGVGIFKRIRNDLAFKKLTLIALGISGAGLMFKSVIG